ncbi:MAG: dihydroorotase [bacterium]|nr:dihydroorotase [bacterium]
MIFDMPNTHRPVIDERRVMERLALVPVGWEDRYWLYVGVTGDRDQLVEAVRCYNTIPQVIGLKMFAGKSVGDLSVTEATDQQYVYRTLTDLRFRGVLAVHCEKESLLRPNRWRATVPASHCSARPTKAEAESVKDQIRFALDAEFQGRLHICHVSSPKSIMAIEEGRHLGLRVTCGVTPHHLMWDRSTMVGEVGRLRKMNPPLRGKEDVTALRDMVRIGLANWFETDHAPHTQEEKLGEPYMSGYPSLELYDEFVAQFLPQVVGLTSERIQAMTDGNIVEAFADKL